MGLWKYLRSAFKNRWNLLIFSGALGFAIVSGAAGVFIPLVLAGELGYLTLLGTNQRYQLLVDSEETARRQQLQSLSAEQRQTQLMSALIPTQRNRYEMLRSRCLEIRRIAGELQGPGEQLSDDALDQLQLDGLDRLLWIYLRMLYTKQSLDQFLKTTTEADIQADITRVEKRLARLDQQAEDPHQQKIRESLEDNLATGQLRLSNFNKAQSTHELMCLEIDRLENKIQTLSELAINRAEPDTIAHQVDSVVSTMMEVEEAMNDLSFATGLEADDDRVPKLLTAEEKVEQEEVSRR
ncbi:MAG: hypothetical protein JW797_02305 [Bradymonadales bacterium]|nr:hypothetical protein [Bradymonadales bacterium]